MRWLGALVEMAVGVEEPLSRQLEAALGGPTVDEVQAGLEPTGLDTRSAVREARDRLITEQRAEVVKAFEAAVGDEVTFVHVRQPAGAALAHKLDGRLRTNDDDRWDGRR